MAKSSGFEELDNAAAASAASWHYIPATMESVTREQLERTAKALSTVDARVLGTVMNMAPTKGPDAYAYGYGYGYTYKASRSDRPRINAVTSQGDVLPDTRMARRAHR